MSVRQHIRETLQKIPPMELFFPADFRMAGSENAIKMALSRLAADGEIKRIAHGIYYVPQFDPLLGELVPGLDEIAKAIAKRDQVQISPTGAYALNRLGLSTQVPTRQVYITNGPPRKIKIRKAEIIFKSTNHRKLAMKGPLSSLIILALDELGSGEISEYMKSRIRELLLKEDPVLLAADAKLAPAWVHDFIYKILKEEKDKSSESNK